MDLLKLAGEVGDATRGVFRQIHRDPELSWEEHRTVAFLLSLIEPMAADNGWTVRNEQGGVWVDIIVDPGVPFFTLLRADIDALPIQEATGLLYASENAGVMHACGHDAHSAMLYGVLVLIAEGHMVPTRNMRLFWQRAEESTRSGAEQAIKDGVLDNVKTGYGLHVWPWAKVGTFLSCKGPLFAQVGRLEIEIECPGGHVMDNRSVSAVDVAASIYGALVRVQIGLNEGLLCERYILKPTMTSMGRAFNIMPSSGSMTYSYRDHFSAEEREIVTSVIINMVQALEGFFRDTTIKAEFHWGCAATVNDARLYTELTEHLGSHGLTTRTVEPTFGGEDFGRFTPHVPCAFYLLGVGSDVEKPGHEVCGVHTSQFRVEEAALAYGVAYWAAIAMAT